VNLPDAGFVTIPVQPIEENEESTSPPTRVHVQLGPSVSIAKGNAGEVQLSGSLEVELANDGTSINGELQAKSGQLDVSGKTFEIERATITFNPKRPAEDPTVFAVARWDSPSDFAVYARYVGSVSQGKLTMYSEPPLTQDQILSLILFGTPEGSFGGTTGGNSAATALGVVGSTATRGLNRALDDITDLDVSTRVDTSTGNARPELVVQLTPRLAAHVTRALGAAAPGEPPDRTFLILDYHLQGGWSLSSSLGDRGASALDLIWRHFY
jgi:translocation and assembly module TamB